jgi:ABC-type branched-subunit amino acid transport system ATPase component
MFPNMTVRENLELGVTGAASPTATRNIEHVAEIFPRLRERFSQNAGTLSGGEQQMLAIGRGMMAEPQLLILDEPSIGLSPLLVEEMFSLIKQLNTGRADDIAGRTERVAVDGNRRPRLRDGKRRDQALGCPGRPDG